MKKTLLLINPNDRETWYRQGLGVKEPFYCNPKLALGYIAALTPEEEWDIMLVDEDVESGDYPNLQPDLVAMTSVTANAPRAYKIARDFKERGIPSIMGGYHATFLPDEPNANGFSSTFRYEAEGCWNQVLADFNAKGLKPLYKGGRPSISKRIRPRRDLFKTNDIWVPAALETTRGCPYPCAFCCITTFNEGDYRARDIDLVIEEIRELKKMGNSNFFFLDDNLLGSKQAHFDRFKELFLRVKEENIRWSCQITMNFTSQPELMTLARESGCSTCFIGMESIGKDSLKSMTKGPVLARLREDSPARIYGDVVKRMHDHGLAVCGAFIFGSDTDTEEVFDQTADFILETQIDTCQLNVMTPIVGTKVYDEMVANKRLIYHNFPEDWAKWNYFDVVYKPKNLTVEQVKEGIIRVYKKIASPKTVVKRTWNTFRNTSGNLGSVAVSYLWTTGFSGSYFRKYGSEYLNQPQRIARSQYGLKNKFLGGVGLLIGIPAALALLLSSPSMAGAGGNPAAYHPYFFALLSLFALPLLNLIIGQGIDKTSLNAGDKLYLSWLSLTCLLFIPLSLIYDLKTGSVGFVSWLFFTYGLFSYLWFVYGQWKTLDYYNYID